MKSSRIKTRRQFVVRSQEYSIETTFKEAGPKKIQTF